jgi:protein tyrosine/serine phosphatase
MSLRNKMKTLLTQEDRDAIDEHIQAIEEILEGKLASLDGEERVRFGRINEKNKLLVNKVYDIHKGQPNLSSPDVDWDEFESDYKARIYLETRISRFSGIIYKMESTKILHDNDNYEDSLKDYAYSKYKNDTNEPGFYTKVSELKQFFARTGILKKSNNKNKG